ncbi:MAG: Ig-like domain-containing protein [Paludibacteraceae bacterium]|nr:Ig-like domain-containing protein [Paludibacteraceae bacterium]
MTKYVRMYKLCTIVFCLVLCYAKTQAVNISGNVNVSSIAADAELVLTGNTTLNMDADKYIRGIKGDYALTISGDKQLVINTGNHGIAVSSLTIAANINIDCSKDGLNTDNDILIKSGSVTIDAGKDAIYSRNGNITIQNGFIKAECGTNCAAIYAKAGNVKISSGTTIARGAKYGIIADVGSITLGGSVTATAAGWAVTAQKDISVLNGQTTAKSCGGAILSTQGSVNISADVDAASTGDGACGIYAKTGINISGGNVSASCSVNGSAILCGNGNVNITGGNVTTSGAKYGIGTDNGSINVSAKVSSKGCWAMASTNGIHIIPPYAILSPVGATAGKTISNPTNPNMPQSYVLIGIPPLSGTVTIDCTTATVGRFLRYKLGGMAYTLQQSGAVITPQWQISDNGESGWTNLTAESDGAYVVGSSDVGKFIRVRISSESCDGYIYSAVRQAQKSQCYVDVVSASLSVTDNKVYLNNPKTTQEYIIVTGKKAVSSLTESDWAKSVTPTSSSKMLLGGTANATNYVYTRVKETPNMLAGTDIPVSWVYAGTNTYLQGISLSCQGVSSTLQSDSYYYYCKLGDVIRVTASPIPSNATNFQGIYYNKWFNNSKSGTFYANQACTEALQSGEYYKTVYFKPSVQRNNVDINAEFQKGYNDIAHDDVTVNVGDANGRFLITNINGKAYVCKGEKQSGLTVDVFPSKATVYGITTSLGSGTGTAPVITFASDGTYSVDATSATAGKYYFNVSQNGTKLIGSISVEVTNYNIEDIILQPSALTVNPGDEIELRPQLLPAQADDKITWSSSNYSVANVSADGKITVNANADIAATATITASVGGKSAKCVLTVAGEKYNLTIDGTQVTSRNMNDILSNSAFAFDGIRTLTVSSDYSTSSQLIVSQIEGLIVEVEKDATLTSDAVVLNVTKNTTITGQGTLTLSRNSGYALQINNNATLNVENAKLNVDGGITCGKAAKARLLIDASYVSAVSHDGNPAIGNLLGGIELSDCQIVKPQNGKIDSATGSIVESNGTVATEVEIESTVTSVETPHRDVSPQARKILKDGNLYICFPDGRIYNAQGQEF